jgi:hypothetical protein
MVQVMRGLLTIMMSASVVLPVMQVAELKTGSKK